MTTASAPGGGADREQILNWVERAETIGASRASMISNLTVVGLDRSGPPADPSRRADRYYRIEDGAFETVVCRRLAAFAAFGDIAEEVVQLRRGDKARTQRIRSAQRSIALLTNLALLASRRRHCGLSHPGRSHPGRAGGSR